jgi:hypothetical protein
MRHIKIAIITLIISLVGYLAAGPLMGASYVFADCNSASGLTSDACKGLNQASGGQANGGGVSIEHVFSTIVDILSLVVGAVAIIVIIYSGLKYVTSAGDTNKVSSAKNALIYALIGLAVAALAQFLVHFVLYQASH